MIRGGADSAKSNFSAQQSNPIRSSKGGYLRCPFAINSNFAELAARHVQASTSNKSNTSAYFDKYAKEVRTGEGDTYSSSNLRKNRSYASNDDESDEENSNDVDRPWTRAGVGARALNAREKRAQQEQAELVYGTGQASRNVSKEADINNIKNSNVNNSATSHSASTTEQVLKSQKLDAELHASSSSVHNVKGKEMFATDMKDQVALQRVLPRKMREKMHRNEENIPEKSTYNRKHDNNYYANNISSCNNNNDKNIISHKDDEDEISKTETVTNNKVCKVTNINTAEDCSTSVPEHQTARKKNRNKKRKQSTSSETNAFEGVLSRNKSQSTQDDKHSVEIGETARNININNSMNDNEQHNQKTSQRTQSTHQHLKVNISPALNRVQQLDALRQQALFGSKRRRQ